MASRRLDPFGIPFGDRTVSIKDKCTMIEESLKASREHGEFETGKRVSLA